MRKLNETSSKHHDEGNQMQPRQCFRESSHKRQVRSDERPLLVALIAVVSFFLCHTPILSTSLVRVHNTL